ncbi:S49 family peptidase [Magnetospirillum fulvum]|uniref:Capsid protein of prophage n=1 Tax=Magnetospirillum fulvum MGU-K5 TaxID=1316936 RepID=S9S9L2_MAGFU|nr:S49 family peptidase [Magnetospirillum fulvum]EPY01389.1 capsid protein of prophage [Magnetospirillum fulvum MGU-K5]
MSPPSASLSPSGGGIKFARLLGKLVNRPLVLTPRRALTLFGMLAPRAGIRADDVVAAQNEDGGGPLLLSRLVSEAVTRPRAQGPKDDGKAYRVQGGVAIIPVTGDLVHDLGSLDPWCGMTGYDGIITKLDLAEADPAVQGALLYVDSPGGEVTQCAVCGDRIRDFQAAKPLRTVYADAGYSAACWLGSQGGRVYAPRTGGTGSIGVITLHADLSRAYDEAGITVTVLSAGAHKGDGHPYAPLPKAVASEIVAELESLRGYFAAAVAAGRDLDLDDVLATEARCLSADEALELGLIDEIMNPDDALAVFIADLATGKSVSTPAGKPAATRSSQGDKMAQRQRAAAKSAQKKTAQDDEDEDGVSAASPEDEGDDDDERDAEDDEDEKECGKKSASSPKAAARQATARIQAIITAPEAEANRTLAQTLAFETTLSVKQARAALAAAAADAQAGGGGTPFAAAMAAFPGAALGVGASGADRSPAGALASAMDRELKNSGLVK